VARDVVEAQGGAAVKLRQAEHTAQKVRREAKEKAQEEACISAWRLG